MPEHPSPSNAAFLPSPTGSWLLCACAAILALALPTLGQPATVVEDVTVGLRNEAGAPVVIEPSDQDPAALFSVREDGVERQVVGVSREDRPWRVVVYVDTALAWPYTIARATRALETLARELVGLGTVEVVVADESARRLLPPSGSVDAVAAALARVNLVERGGDAIVELRRETELELQMTASPQEARVVALDSAAREAALVQQRLDLLLGYLAESEGTAADDDDAGDATGPKALLWIGDGFDLDPSVHWRDQPGLADLVLAELTADGATPLAAAQEELARSLAALGWTVVPVTTRQVRDEDPSRWGAGPYEDPVENRTRVLPRVTLGRKTPEQRAEEALREEAGPPPVPVAPDVPLLAMATATGGRVVDSVGGLPTAIADLAGRYRVRFVTTRDAARASVGVGVGDGDGDGEGDGEGHGEGDVGGGDPLAPLAVTSRSTTATAAAPAWTARGTPPAVSALRARRLLAGELDPGEVTVRAVLGVEPGDRARLEVRVEPAPMDAGVAAGPRRLTLAAQPADGGPPTVTHRVVEGRVTGAEMEPAEGAPAATVERAAEIEQWVYAGDLDLPATTERLAVVVEEVGPAVAGTSRRGGTRWGGTVAGIFDARAGTGLGSSGYDVASGLLPGPRPVTLLRPQGEMLTGGVLFDTVVDAAVARVEFFVDGRRRERVEAAPFRARLDLGRLPELRRVAVVAHDATGAELGRDEMTVNGGTGRLRVRIRQPAETRAVGPVDVSADVDLPQGAVLDRVEVYWRDRLAATLFQAPFRHRLFVPADDPEGTLRVVARLADGTQSEDVTYLNGPLAGDRIDVRLTELYVVVTGRDGRPVRDLTADDFVVRENGERQRVETFSAAGDLPITIGLAIDSSASMFVKLPEVQEAASEFLGELSAGRDHAFLVDFDDEVRLAAATTGELGDVRAAGYRLVPDGRTSLWKAVVYSLVQLQSAPGRKALVVYSDGADEDDDFPFRDALAFARKVAVPIYVIVSNDEAVRTGGIPIGFPSLGRRLERLTSEVGGRVWLVRRGEDLSGVYRQIQQELSAQYLLGYYPDSDGLVDGLRDWRRIEVDVEGRGLEARTLAGYER